MENFIYSINATLPVFLMMALGWALKSRPSKKGMLDKNFAAAANKFNYAVTLPVMLFYDISSVDICGTFDLEYVAFCALASTACFFIIWGLTKVFMRRIEKTSPDRLKEGMTGAFVQASFRSSAAVMGMAFIENMYGSSAMGPMMIIGAVPLYNIYSVIVLVFENGSKDGRMGVSKIAEAVSDIFKNPIILSIFLGIASSLFGLRFPAFFQKTMENTAKMATPLMLVAMGAGFEEKKAAAKIKPALAASLIKLVVQAAVFVPIAVKLGFFGEKMIGILIMLAAPSTPSCYIMAKNLGGDGDLTASIVAITTLLAAFTLTIWIFILKTYGIV